MILAILQARVSSSRLPGKVLEGILGKPMIERQIERVRRARRIERFVLATSTDSRDDSLAELGERIAVDCFRGSLDDVLDRFYQAARVYGAAHVVRLTGDCPLADPELIDKVIDFHVAGNFDYTSNTLKPSFPDGLDVEVLRFSALAHAWREADLPSEREHVTSFIYKHPERFQLGSYAGPEDLSHLRWTVDERKDLEFVRRVYEALYPGKPDFGIQDVLKLLASHPELTKINCTIERNAGYRKSVLGDARYLEQEQKGE